MTRVIVDPATRAKLVNAHQPLELCDDSGKVLGQFIPVADDSRRLGTVPQVDDEELDRRERQGGGRPLAEILSNLGSNG